MGKVRKQWSEDQIKSAISTVKSGVSIRKVSQRTGIPTSTIWSKLTGKRSLNNKAGPPTILTSEEELKIVEWVSQLNNRGFPITKSQLLNNVENFVKNLKRTTAFNNNRPGRHWYEGFLHRHPNVASSMRQNSTVSKLVSKEKLGSWFREMKVHLDKIGIDTLDGSRIFNLDKFTFYFCSEHEKVYSKKREKGVKNNMKENEKECLTVVLITNAFGMLVPPMILFNYKRIPYSINQSAPSDWILDKSTNGRLSTKTLLNYVTNDFNLWLTKNNIQRPIVLYIDDHSSHVTYPLLEFCLENQIELIALYPNSSHILMPLNVSLFKPLTNAWRKCISNFSKQNKIRKEDYCRLLESALNSLNLQEIMYDGFRKTGLFPFSPDALKYIDIPNILNPPKVTTIKEDKKYIEEAKRSLQYSERFIDSTILQEFKKNKEDEEWTGELKHKSLFCLWSAISKCSRNNTTTIPENLSNDFHDKTSENKNKNIVSNNANKTSFDITFNQLIPDESDDDSRSFDLE